MSVDRPLTDAQERALIILADAWDDWTNGGPQAREPWRHKPCRNVQTLEALKRLGLIDVRLYHSTLEWEARITQEGLSLVRGMGD